MVKTDSVTLLGGMDVMGAKLEVSSDGSVFSGAVKSGNAAADAIKTMGTTTFTKGIFGNLTTAAATRLEGADAVFSGFDLTLGAALANAGGSIAIANAKTLTLGADLDNAGLTTFAKGAVFAAPEPASLVQNNAGGRIIADVGMVGLSDLASRTRLNDAASRFDFTTAESATLSTSLAFNYIADNAAVTFGSTRPDAVLEINNAYDFRQAAVAVGEGIVALGENSSLAAGTFSLDQGAELRYLAASGSAAVTAATSTLRGVVDVREAGGRLDFDGNLSLMNGTQIRLTADSAGIGKIATLNLGSLAIYDGVTVAIRGAPEDVLNKPLLIADGGAANKVNGWEYLNKEGASRYEFSLDPNGDVWAVRLRGTGETIGDGNSHNPGDIIGGGDKSTGSDNKDEGAHYVDDIYANDGSGLGSEVGDYIDQTLGLNDSDRYNAFGQLIGEYAAVGSSSVMAVNDLFFKAVYNQMGLNQNSFGTDMAWGGKSRSSDHAYANMEQDSSPNSALWRGKNCFTARSNPGKIWGGFLGGVTRQDERARVPGYDFRAGGAILGYDRQSDRFIYGFAASYLRGRTDVDDLGTRYDSDYLNVGAYGSFHHESGFYAKAGLGYDHGWNDYDVNMIVGGQKHGSYGNSAFFANGEFGAMLCVGGVVNLNPSVGLRFMHMRQDGWTENLSGGTANIANWFRKERQNAVDVPMTLRINSVLQLGGVELAPEARLGWIFAAKKNCSSVTTGFVGTDQAMVLYGVDPGWNRYLLGVGIKAKFNDRIDAGLDYNFETRPSYRHHNLSAIVGVTF